MCSPEFVGVRNDTRVDSAFVIQKAARTALHRDCIVEEFLANFLADVVTTFGDLIASIGYIVIGLIVRRLWLVVLLALVWAVISYGLYQSDQLGIEITDVFQEMEWTLAQELLLPRLPVAVVMSVFAWFCMSLMIGSFRPRRRGAAASGRGRDVATDKLPALPRGSGGDKGVRRQEPSFLQPSQEHGAGAGLVAPPAALATAGPTMMAAEAEPPMSPEPTAPEPTVSEPIAPQPPAQGHTAGSGDGAYSPAATADKLGRIYSERELDDLIAALQEKRTNSPDD